MRRWYLVLGSIVTIATATLVGVQQAQASPRPRTTTVNIPGEDRFAPFAVTVRVGDREHGGPGGQFRRLCLHATRLGFAHPVSGKAMRFESAASAAWV